MPHGPPPLLALVILTALAPAAWAQQDTVPPPPPSRIRLCAPPLLPDTADGVVVGLDGQALTFRRLGEEQSLVVPLESIVLLQVHSARSAVIRGVVTGTTVGAALGAFIGSVGSGCAACQHEEHAGVGSRMLSLGLAGGVVGLVVGALASMGTWDSVPLDTVRLGRIRAGRAGP